MNLKLFYLIHHESPRNSYYLAPAKKKGRLLYRFVKSCNNYVQAAFLPFNSKYNKQQFDGEEKSRLSMLIESLHWTIKYKEVCRYYFLYGLDLKGKSPKDYVAYSEFRVLRNILNIRQRENLETLYTFNYLALTRDKFVFSQYCKSLGIPFPKTIALWQKGNLLSADDVNYNNLQRGVNLFKQNMDAFCKESSGESGRGAFALKIDDGKIYVNGKETTEDVLIKRFGDSDYIIQQRLCNHPELDRIYSGSLNTIKLITILNDDGSVDFFDSVIRFGSGGNVVDNASQGGIFVGIEKNGALQDVGYREPGAAKDLVVKGVHPDTGASFAGMKVPFWNELLAAAKGLHRYFYGVPSIGWDIAVTPDGYVFTETGEDWEIPVYQVTHGGLRKKFYKYHGKALDVKLRRF